MGAINNAFNQAVGAVAGAALAYKHAKETDFSKMNTAENSALVARNQSRTAEAEANDAYYEATKEGGLTSQLAEAETNEAEAKKAFEESRKNGAPEDMFKKYTELDAAKEAASKLRDKYKAIEDMIARANEQRAHAEKATEIALKAQHKYQSRWGGK